MNISYLVVITYQRLSVYTGASAKKSYGLKVQYRRYISTTKPQP